MFIHQKTIGCPRPRTRTICIVILMFLIKTNVNTRTTSFEPDNECLSTLGNKSCA